jgi:RNA ligase
MDKAWNQFTLMARGLILCPSEKRVVATPIPKFFNYGEVLDVPELPFNATVKMDGSL